MTMQQSAKNLHNRLRLTEKGFKRMSNDAVTASPVPTLIVAQARNHVADFESAMSAGRPFDARHAARQLMQTALAAYDLATMSAHQRIDHNIPRRSDSFVAPSDVDGD